MWRYGQVGGFTWEAKVFGNPSMWGIADGRISKLWIYDAGGTEVYGYDRDPSMGDTIGAADLRAILAEIDPSWDFSGEVPAAEADEDADFTYEPLPLGKTPVTTSVVHNVLPSGSTRGTDCL